MPKKSRKSLAKSGMLGPSARSASRLLSGTKAAGVPPHHLAQLVYPVAFTSSSTTANIWYWQFRLNSLYDPDFTGGGAQPTTFDQWMALYDRYRVFACEVDLTLSSIDGVTPMVAAMAPGQDAAPTLSYTGIAGCRDVCLGKSQYMAMSHMRKTYLIRDVFGVDEEAVMSELNFAGTSSSSAPSVAYLTIGAFTAGATTAVMLTGFLRFAVRFENPHMNNVSLEVRRPTPAEAAASAAPTPMPLTAVERGLFQERDRLTAELRQLRAQAGLTQKAPLDSK